MTSQYSEAAMRTNRHPYDYNRKIERPSAKVQQMEDDCVALLLELYRYYDRGLITKSELYRLQKEGMK
jgi:hypothetical protein